MRGVGEKEKYFDYDRGGREVTKVIILHNKGGRMESKTNILKDEVNIDQPLRLNLNILKRCMIN